LEIVINIAIISINKPSLDASLKLKQICLEYKFDIFTNKKTYDLLKNNSNIFYFNKLQDILNNVWYKYDIIICILAIGAVIRQIAPLLQSKKSDPAVIVVDINLNKIVPLLSGHLGGANQFSIYLENKLPNSVNFISTATDQMQVLSFDMLAKKYNWEIDNINYLANLSNRLLNKQIVYIATYNKIFKIFKNNKYIKQIDFNKIDNNTVVIAPFNIKNTLVLKPKFYIGIGCAKGVSKNLIHKAFNNFIQKYNLDILSLGGFGSFIKKQNEVGLLEFVQDLRQSIDFFDKKSINTLEYNFSKSSSTKIFETKGVAEPSSLLCSNFYELIITKKVYYKKIILACAV
jgi:cobalt-precorrin 5A hydrolase